MTNYLFIYLIIINLISFTQMGIDKQRAIKQEWRIAEKTIWVVALIGGALGTFAGMNYFHHKTKHKQFKYGIPVLIIIEFVILLWLFQ